MTAFHTHNFLKYTSSEAFCDGKSSTIAFYMPANLENSAVATGLEKFSFHSNPKETMPMNAQNTAQLHLSHTLESNAQNSPSQAPNSSGQFFNYMRAMNFQMFKLD